MSFFINHHQLGFRKIFTHSKFIFFLRDVERFTAEYVLYSHYQHYKDGFLI